MNIDDLVKQILLKVDALKDLSFEDVKTFVLENLSIVLSIVIGSVVLIIVAILIYNSFNDYTDLDSRLSVLRSKEEPVTQNEKIKKNINKFRDGLRPALSEDQMISYISARADKRGIVIESFEPVQVIFKSFYQETKLNFSCRSENFTKTMLFIKDLENSDFLIKVDMIDMRKLDVAATANAPAHSALSFIINVTSIKLLGDENKKPKKK